jgi:ankyrin repeat protein
MHLLCSAGAHVTILRLLDSLQTIDINMRDEDMSTPLMKAIHRDSTADHEKVVQILINNYWVIKLEYVLQLQRKIPISANN